MQINLPSSKSEANRLLIIQALCNKEGFRINKLSSARDTQTLNSLLNQKSDLVEFNVLDAGTAMRFLTAYLAITTKKDVVLTGTNRMQQRPIGVLVEALNKLGAEIQYKNKEGFPPLAITPIKALKTNKIAIAGNISSQYISALLMVAPILEKGLKLTIEKPIFSQPYIDMTLGLMQAAGISYEKNDNVYSIANQEYKAAEITVESDWSGASYWFSFIALSPVGTQVFLKGLREKSNQGDQAIKTIMNKLGVETIFEDTGVLIEKINTQLPNQLVLDFKEFPDLAQTVVACCAALKVNLTLSGLESLKIKETDRISALNNELQQFNCSLKESEKEQWKLLAKNFEIPEKVLIKTYEDHRMAMSFLPLALFTKLEIEDIEVVNKSYPSFWEDAQSLGFNIQTV